MKRLKEYFCKVNCSSILTALALVFVTIAANTTCMCLYYQPEMPDEVKNFRKII